MQKYNPKKIEKKWQKAWQAKKVFKASDASKNKKFYVLVEFPYPSGDGLHVGHCRSYTALDAVARKRRMQGFNVLFPMGWDAFGLPAENYAIKTGIHPSITVAKNIRNFKNQMNSLGLSFDWSREINTTDPAYYKWTQWIFLQFFKKGLAYQAEMPINWCPSCKIGLANEEVVSGKCERCGTQVEQRIIKQWMLAITKYADRLLSDLKDVDYLEKIKAQQIEWIGKSQGAEVYFNLENSSEKITVFTTRPDTIFGVTAVVLAPEHKLAEKLIKPEQKSEVLEYIKQSKQKSEFERTKLEKGKTGVFTGSYCKNPVNGEKIPVWLGDYVVASYGGGAVMVVPAHDKRDFEFAKKYKLGIKEVVAGGDILKEAFVDYGKLVNSGEFSGLASQDAIKNITEWLEKNNYGKNKIYYKLRDWVFSRQHYWGEPIPIIHCKKCGAVAVPEKDLPVKLPFVKNYKPTGTGRSPLEAVESWVNVKCPKCKGQAKRETDTMPNWAGSSWYYLRYIDPKNKKKLADEKKLKNWLPVDWYNGGMEHTTLHLLYSRFWHKFLNDIKAVPFKEPYQKRTSHGMVLSYDSQKMSKSRGNVINPDDIIKEYGADTMRIYEMFMGPFEQAIPWDTKGVNGARRFLEKIWKLKTGNKKNDSDALVQKTIKKVGEDIEAMKFNTAISALMILVNEFFAKETVAKEDFKNLLLLLSPFAPHLAEELWQREGFRGLCCQQKWPEYNAKQIKEQKVLLIVQINGKVRDKISATAGISQKQAEELVLKSEKIKNWLQQNQPKKVIFVPDKLINIVI